MTYESEVLADAPLAYYRLGEASGSTMVDATTNGRNGSYAVAPVLGTTGLLVGDANTAAEFQGNGAGYAEIADAAWMDVSSLTVEAWIKPDVVDSTRNIVIRDGGTRHWIFRITATGKIDFAIWNNSSTLYQATTAGSVIAAATKYHVVGVFNGSTAKVYVNGVEAASVAVTGTVLTGTQLINISGGTSIQRFDGVIDEVAIYGTALSAARILAHYDVGRGAPVNDAFVNAIPAVIATNGATYTSSQTPSALATTESGEPAAVGGANNKSCWWKVTPLTSGTVTFDTVGSFQTGDPSSSSADTQIAVYTGSAVNALTTVAANEDSGNQHGGKTFSSWLQFAGVAGTTYYLQAGTWSSSNPLTYVVNVTGPATVATSSIALNRASETDTARPISVASESEIAISRASETDTARAMSLLQSQEIPVGRSSETDTARPLSVLEAQAAETGRASEVDTANQITADEASPGDPLNRASEVDTARTMGVAGQTLALGRASEVDLARPLTPLSPQSVALNRASEVDTARPLSVFVTPPPPPPHDAQADALAIDGTYGGVSMTLTAATLESGEAVVGGDIATVWAKWTSEDSEDITFTLDPAEDVPLSITIWDSLGVMVTQSASSRTATFPAVAGETYWIQIGTSATTVDFDLRWAMAPIVVAPGEAFEFVRVEVYDSTGLNLISEVPRRRGVAWQEPHNEVGTGEVTILLNDEVMVAYPNLLKTNNIVKFWLGDKCVHGFRIRRRRTVIVSSEEHGTFKARTVSGPSVMHLLDDMIVRHDGKARDRSLSTRSFAWFSPRHAWYNEVDWSGYYNSNPQSDPPGVQALPEDRPKWKNPPKFPDPAAQWMWMSPDPTDNEGGYDPINDMLGQRYWRKEFSTSERQVVRLYASADELYRVYLDGELVLGGDGEEMGFTETQTRKLVLHPGDHVIAIRASQFSQDPIMEDADPPEEDPEADPDADPPAENPDPPAKVRVDDPMDAVIFTMMRLDDKGHPKSTIVRSNPNWLTTYSRPVPTWNRAQVLRRVVQEARDRGIESADALSFGFTGSTDSAGKVWSDRFNEDVEIGTTALSLQGMLSEGNGFDVWVDPETMTLEAWNRRGIDKSSSVTLEVGRNLLGWEVEEIDEIKTDFFIQYDGGWTEWIAPVAGARHGHREALVTLGNTKDDRQAERIVKKASQGISWAIKRAGTPDIVKRKENDPAGNMIAVDGARPFIDFGPGDTVKAPNESNVLKPHRVMMLSGMEDSDGNLTYDPVLEEVNG